MANLYRVSAGATPVAFVRQKRMALKEDIRFFADENETRELFRLKARARDGQRSLRRARRRASGSASSAKSSGSR